MLDSLQANPETTVDSPCSSKAPEEVLWQTGLRHGGSSVGIGNRVGGNVVYVQDDSGAIDQDTGEADVNTWPVQVEDSRARTNRTRKNQSRKAARFAYHIHPSPMLVPMRLSTPQGLSTTSRALGDRSLDIGESRPAEVVGLVCYSAVEEGHLR